MMLLVAMARSNAAAAQQCRTFITHPSGFLPSRCLRHLIFCYGPQLLSSREGSALNGRAFSPPYSVRYSCDATPVVILGSPSVILASAPPEADWSTALDHRGGGRQSQR